MYVCAYVCMYVCMYVRMIDGHSFPLSLPQVGTHAELIKEGGRYQRLVNEQLWSSSNDLVSLAQQHSNASHHRLMTHTPFMG